jgi:HAD superfamily hydrolase (TIGR01509 family)
VDLYFFDLDKTLYAYDFRKRLPELSRVSGVSQYDLAKTWWAAGYEARAESGEWPTVDEYLDQFAHVTGGRRLSLDEWAHARSLAMTRIDGSVAALRRAAELGTVSLLSNNPAPLAAALPGLAPDVVEILGPNILVSYMLRARKPDPELFVRALAHYEVAAENAFLADDSAANVAGARSVGITAHQLVPVDGVPQTDALMSAVESFARRNA